MKVDLLKEAMLKAAHGLDYIEHVIGTPIRKKVERLKEGKYVVKLINGEKLFAQLISPNNKPTEWQFSYKGQNKCTDIPGSGIKYHNELETDFIPPYDMVVHLCKLYDPNADYSDDYSKVKRHQEIKEQIVILLPFIKKVERKKLTKLFPNIKFLS